MGRKEVRDYEKRISEKAEPQYPEIICMNYFHRGEETNWLVNKNGVIRLLGEISA